MKNILFLFFLIPTVLFSQKMSEAQYIRIINKMLQGQEEYRVTSGWVDILTATHAIEVERAHKWKQSIGQALWYGLQTEKKPGIILLIEQASDYKYFIQLNTALDYAGLTDKIEVWQYPQDFPAAATYQSEILETHTNPENGTQTYWKSSSSSVRHNSSCKYYQKTRGKKCTAEEGIACKICGG